jgi:hypothetical protein
MAVLENWRQLLDGQTAFTMREILAATPRSGTTLSARLKRFITPDKRRLVFNASRIGEYSKFHKCR